MYLLPVQGIADADFAAQVALLRSKFQEGPIVKVGFSFFVFLPMPEWNVDVADPASIRSNLASTIAQIDRAVRLGVDHNIPIALSIISSIRARSDGAKDAAAAEDRRNFQWYTDGMLATNWWSQSQYARKQRRIREAYVREVGKVIANYMARYPNTLIAAAGDGEIELSTERWVDVAVGDPKTWSWADYSPFAVAEFRDWLRGTGLYAPGQPLEGRAYANSARYTNDETPSRDTSGDGHTLNGDFCTDFSSWSLRYFDWSLTDDPNNDAKAIPLSRYGTEGEPSMPDGNANGFDPPRTCTTTAPRTCTTGSDWWNAWSRFRQEMVWRTNIDFAKWITTSPDPASGATIPAERFYSNQIPADYLFGSPASDLGVRLTTSASPWWTADIRPYGSLGITAYNVRHPQAGPGGIDLYSRTLVHVAPVIAERNVRYGIIEWNPSDPSTTDPAVYRQEMEIVERYRPHLLIPFMWGDPHWQVLGSGFEVALQELLGRIKAASSRLLAEVAVPSRVAAQQPFPVTGYAFDRGISGPAWPTGVDAVRVYATLRSAQPAEPVLLGEAAATLFSSEAAELYGSRFANSGFSVNAAGLARGAYQITVHVRSTLTGAFAEYFSTMLEVQ